MSRFLIVDTDGETILGTLSMPEADALLNISGGQTLLAVDPNEDTGAIINDAQVRISSTGTLEAKPGITLANPLPDFALQDVVT